MILFGLLGCSEISGLWRDYSFNKAELPMENCDREICSGVEAFTMELNEDHVGDFRVELQKDNEFFIYTFPLQATVSNPSGAQDRWTLFVDNSENTDFPEEWYCWVRGRLVDCTVGEDLYQLQRGRYPK